MNTKLTILAAGCMLALAACTKNETRYFADPNSNGQAIFSNTGNNLMTCFIQGKPWRTPDRTIGGFAGNVERSEVELLYIDAVAANDTLLFEWRGYFTGDDFVNSTIALKIPVANGFSKAQFSQFQGQRLSLDGTNGYGTVSAPGVSEAVCKADVYFHEAKLVSTAAGLDSGFVSGLLEMGTASFKLTNGRFDHKLGTDQVRW